MSSNTHKEGVEQLTLEVLEPIRDFVIRFGIPEKPGNNLMKMTIQIDENRLRLHILVDSTPHLLKMRVTSRKDVPPEDYTIVSFKEKHHCLFLDKETDPSDILTLSMAVQAGFGLFDTSPILEQN